MKKNFIVLFFLLNVYRCGLGQSHKPSEFGSPSLETYDFTIWSPVIQPDLASFFYVPAFGMATQTFWYAPSVSFMVSTSFASSDNMRRFGTHGIALFGVGIGGLFNLDYEGISIWNYRDYRAVKKYFSFGSERILYPYITTEFLASGGYQNPFMHLFLGIFLRAGYLIRDMDFTKVTWDSRNIFWILGVRMVYGLEFGLSSLFTEQLVFYFAINFPLGLNYMFWRGAGNLSEEEYVNFVIKVYPPNPVATLEHPLTSISAGTDLLSIPVFIENKGVHPAIGFEAFVSASKEDLSFFIDKEFMLANVFNNKPDVFYLKITVPYSTSPKKVQAKLVFKEKNGYTPTPLDISFEITPSLRFKKQPNDEDQ